MTFLFGFLMAVHILVSFVLIIVVLLQAGKGGGMAGLFGGGGDTIFGGQGADRPMAIVTGICAAVFIITCLTLSYMSRGVRIHSVTDTSPSQQQMPTQPAPQT